jgi:hypothetical protein
VDMAISGGAGRQPRASNRRADIGRGRAAG